MLVRSLVWEDLLEKGMGIYSSILAWRTIDRGACRAIGRKELDTTEWLTLLLLKQHGFAFSECHINGNISLFVSGIMSS